jgi:hypothetical protein
MATPDKSVEEPNKFAIDINEVLVGDISDIADKNSFARQMENVSDGALAVSDVLLGNFRGAMDLEIGGERPVAKSYISNDESDGRIIAENYSDDQMPTNGYSGGTYIGLSEALDILLADTFEV